MKILEAVNLCLRALNHAAVNEIGAGDENSALVKTTVESVRKEILIEGYDFNTDRVSMAVDSSGKMPVSPTWLKIRGLPRGITVRYHTDGSGYLWDRPNNEWYAQPLEGIDVVFDITTFHQIPEHFARWIAHESAVRCFQQFNKSDPPRTLIQQRNRAQGNAAATIENISINTGNGFNRLLAAHHGTTTPVRAGGEWVFV